VSCRSGPGSIPGHMEFVVDEVALRYVSSQYLGFPCQFSFYRLLHIRHHLSSWDVTVGQLVTDVPSRLSHTPPQEKNYTLISRSDETFPCTQVHFILEKHQIIRLIMVVRCIFPILVHFLTWHHELVAHSSWAS
jgi:hypothetical protein